MSSTPSMFYAYSARPADVAETVESAIKQINQGNAINVVGWKSLSVGGKLLVQEITRAIDESDILACDLTVLNHNVLFELGYGIGKDRRIWISVSEIMDPEKRGVRKIEPLLPVGHARYVNTSQLVSRFYADQPWEDLSVTLAISAGALSPLRRRVASLLYLKSRLATDSSLALSQAIESSNIFGEQIVDDPSEVPHESLEWYIQKVRRADAVVVHLMSNRDEGSDSHNGKCSLVAGIAHGMGKPLIMLAHAPFQTPLDYETLLKVHETSGQCKTHINRWLSENETTITERHRQTYQFDLTRRAGNDLARLSVGETVAENESHLIDEYFLETGAYWHAVNGSQTIFVGRKGTGKTANFYAVAAELKRDTRNHVCIVKPISYELDGVLGLLRRTIDRAERGYLVESLWKFLLYTELSKTVTNEMSQRPPYHHPSEEEKELLGFVEEHSELIDPSFSLRLQRVVDRLAAMDSHGTMEEKRSRISVLLHENLLARLRALLGAALADRKQVSVLVDNLDKVWGQRDETEVLSQLLFGLLGVTGRIAQEFRAGNPRRPAANVTLAVFLRSDIFTVIQDVAREPDKISFERITWDDADLLMRVVDNRLRYSLDESALAPAIWSKYFTPEVQGHDTRSYIGRYVIPRPRDAIYFVREALSQAVNRGHTMVEAEDIAAAADAYSQYAFDALLVEDDPRTGRLEEILYEFAGSKAIVTREDVELFMSNAGVELYLMGRYIELLLDTNFLGIPKGEGKYEYPIDESRRRVAQRIARQIAEKTERPEHFEINNVFRPVLQIGD